MLYIDNFKMEDKIYYIGQYLDILFLPYVCLIYRKEDIQEIYNYKMKVKDFYNDQEIIETNVYNVIDQKNWNEYNLYSCFHENYDTIKIFKTIVCFYDEEKQDLKRDVLQKYFESATEILFDVLKKNIKSIEEFKQLRKRMKYIFKLFPVELKNKIFSLYPYPNTSLYEAEDATNLLTDTILKQCKEIYKYNDNIINKFYVSDNLCDHDKKIMDPIIEVIKKNPQCVDLTEFQKEDNYKVDEKKLLKQNEEKVKSIISLIENEKSFKINEQLAKVFSLSIKGYKFLLSWACYLKATFITLLHIDEIKEFIESKTFFSYLINNGYGINEIKKSLCFGLYILELSIIAEKLKSEYPKKYHFLGFPQTIIQPYSVFKDIVKILTKETRNNFVYKLFKLKDSKGKKNILYFIKKDKEINPTDFIQTLKENIKKSSKYLIVAINNSIYSLNQITDYEETRKSVYPIKLSLCGKNYALDNIIIYHEHHYEGHDIKNDERYKDAEEVYEKDFELFNRIDWHFHMLIYKQY